MHVYIDNRTQPVDENRVVWRTTHTPLIIGYTATVHMAYFKKTTMIKKKNVTFKFLLHYRVRDQKKKKKNHQIDIVILDNYVNFYFSLCFVYKI